MPIHPSFVLYVSHTFNRSHLTLPLVWSIPARRFQESKFMLSRNGHLSLLPVQSLYASMCQPVTRNPICFSSFVKVAPEVNCCNN